MSKFGYATATLFTAAVAASCAASPAAAAPPCDNPTPELVQFCKNLRDMQNLGTSGPTLVPTAPAPSTGTGDDLYGGHPISHYAVVAVIAVLVIAAAVKLVSWAAASTAEDAERIAEQRQVDLNRGRAIAQVADTAQEARSPEDLQRYAAFQWAVPWQRGTAFGNLVDRDGGTGRVHAAWTEACELARLGHWDEQGVFTPAATVANVNGYDDGSGDLELSVNTADYTVGEKQLNKVLEHLVRTARVETASDFTRNAVRDWHITRLSMNPAAQQVQEPEQDAPAPDPAANWEW
jgi:hypothetical protein